MNEIRSQYPRPVAHLIWDNILIGPDDAVDVYEIAWNGAKCADGSDPFPVFTQQQMEEYASAHLQEIWALCYLHDWDPPKEGQQHKWEPGKNVFPEVHAFYRTWQEAEAIRQDMERGKDKYWVVRARPENEARLAKTKLRLRPSLDDLSGALNALMAKLADLLDEDKFHDCEEICRKAGIVAPTGDEAKKCEMCSGDGFYFRLPSGMNPFLMGAQKIGQHSQKITCSCRADAVKGIAP